MPKGYWIVRVDVTDLERYKAYIAANAQPFKKYEPASWSGPADLKILRARAALAMWRSSFLRIRLPSTAGGRPNTRKHSS